jgi:predicted MFS family arabinose efflux permease
VKARKQRAIAMLGLGLGVGLIFALAFAAYLEPSNAWRWSYLISLCQ